MAINGSGVSEVIKKLEEQVKCPICLQVCTEPKILHCAHVFCKKCLCSLLNNNSDSRKIICPNCRLPTAGFDDVDELQAAFQTNQLIELLYELRAKDKTGNQLAPNVAQPIEGEEGVVLCVEHKQPCNLYCRTCNSVICAHCMVMAHQTHNYFIAKAEFGKCKVELMSNLIKADGMIRKMQGGLSDLDSNGHLIDHKRAAIRSEIQARMLCLHAALCKRESELLNDADTVAAHKLHSLQVEKDELHSKLGPLQHVFESVKETLVASSTERLLVEKQSLLDEMEHHITACQLETLAINTKLDLKFACTSDIDGTLKKYGKVCAPGFPDMTKCFAEGEGVEGPIAGTLSTFNVTIQDFCEEPCEDITLDSLDFQFYLTISGQIKHGVVTKISPGKYEFSYVPPTRGEYTLNVTVDGKHIKDSPFSVTAEDSVNNVGTVLHLICGLDSPCGVCFTTSGDVVIAESGGQTVSILSLAGEKLQSFSALSNVECSNYCGLAVDKEDKILVVDSANHCIKQFSSSGELINTIGSLGSGILEFLYPQDVVFNYTDNRIYTIDQNNRVQVLNADLTFAKMFGRYGSGNSHINTPHGIACDNHGNLYVADTNNHRVVAFSPQGRMVKKFTKPELFSPISVDVDHVGRVYVGEVGNYISVFSTRGSLLSSFKAGSETSKQKCSVSFAFAVHKNGTLYVCDTHNNKVLVF